MLRAAPSVLAICVLAALSAPVAAAATGPAKPDAIGAALDTYVRPLVDAGHLSGQLLVSRNGTILLERTWGQANRELGVAMTPDTRINIASITKPVTVILATQLIQEGKLNLEDTLDKWIPGFSAGDSITVQHLLRHRSGIPHRVTTDKDETEPISPAQLAEFAKKATLLFPPGEKNSYSSAGFTVLTRVLELASGQDYSTLLKERIYGPLGLTRTVHADMRTIVEGRAASYLPGLKGFSNAPLKDMSFLAGAGSLYSTAREVHLMLQAVVSGKMGEGPKLSFVRSGKLGWNGSSNGYRAFADWDSATGVAIVYCGNVHTGAPDLMREAIPKLLAGEKILPAVLPDVVARTGNSGTATMVADDAALRRFEGVYQLGNGQRLEVRAHGGVLNANDWILVPTAPDAFFSLRDYGVVKPVLAANGSIERFDWMVGGENYPAPRVADLP